MHIFTYRRQAAVQYITVISLDNSKNTDRVTLNENAIKKGL